MYIEILICAVVIFFVCEYSGIVSTSRFINDYQPVLSKFKESDYDFLLKARYGGEVDVEAMYNKRLKNAFLVLAFSLFFLIADLSYVTIILAGMIAVGVFKLPYIDLKNYRKRHMHEIDVQLPYYLKSLEILIQHYTVPVAIGKSIDTAPSIFKEGLQKLIDSLNRGDSSIEPYMQFARDYPVRDSMRMMRLLYRLGLGKQERKQEQLITFSKTISNLQQKARETKYKNRLEKMESKTMQMLIYTGIGVMILMIISILMTFGG
ncbi:MAG TPA: hypothetical protein DCY94_02810 [Firmicutes bacterium]|nr:hypothetical protein [Bacillota bacterium]